jgi:hypothetical protein
MKGAAPCVIHVDSASAFESFCQKDITRIFQKDEHDVGHSPQTRSFHSSDSIPSRSAAELLHTQKTKLPYLATVYLRNTRHHALTIFDYIDLPRVFKTIKEEKRKGWPITTNPSDTFKWLVKKGSYPQKRTMNSLLPHVCWIYGVVCISSITT